MNDKILKVLKVTGYLLTGAAAMLVSYVGNKECENALPKMVSEHLASNLRFTKKD